MNWEIGIDIYTLICIKWITNKNLLYKKINKIKFKNSKKKKSGPGSVQKLLLGSCALRGQAIGDGGGQKKDGRNVIHSYQTPAS